MLYRAHWKGAVVILAVSVPLLLLSGLAFAIALKHDIVGAILFLAAIWFCVQFVRQGLSVLSRRYEVGPDGLRRRDDFGLRRDGFAWSDVDKWLVWPTRASNREDAIRRLYSDDGLPRPRSDYRGVVFSVRNRKTRFLIDEWEVSVPSFERFLADVRERIGDRELTLGTGAAMSAVEPGPENAIRVSTAASIRETQKQREH